MRMKIFQILQWSLLLTPIPIQIPVPIPASVYVTFVMNSLTLTNLIIAKTWNMSWDENDCAGVSANHLNMSNCQKHFGSFQHTAKLLQRTTTIIHAIYKLWAHVSQPELFVYV